MNKKLKFDYIALVAGGYAALADSGGFIAVTPASGGTAGSLATILRTANLRHGKRIVALSADFFRQTVKLPSVQTEGLTSAELASALCYEVEPFSNISEKAGILSYIRREPEGENSVFDVIQISESEYASLSKTIEAQGGRLAAAGVPPEGWSAEIEPADYTAIAKAVAQGHSPVPLASKDTGGIIPANPLPYAVLLGIAAAALCAADMTMLKSSISKLRPDVSNRASMAEYNKSLLSEIASVKAETLRIEKRKADAAASAQKRRMASSAWHSLFEAAGECADKMTVVTSVRKESSFRCTVGALSSSAESAGQYMRELSGKLGNSGWILIPGNISRDGAGALVRFSFTLSFPQLDNTDSATAATEIW